MKELLFCADLKSSFVLKFRKLLAPDIGIDAKLPATTLIFTAILRRFSSVIYFGTWKYYQRS
jgi:hypothetical protein